MTAAAVGGPSALVYNSNTVDVHPTALFQVDTDPNAPVPTQIQARLNWNGSTGSWVTFSTSGHSAGDSYVLAVQTSSAVSTTGRYSYAVDVTATVNGNTLSTSGSGNALVIARDSSPYGAGWWPAGLDSLVSVTGGMMYVYGAGGARFFSGSGGTYTSPADDFGTLVKNGDNTYTYTDPHHTQSQFNTSGLLTRVTNSDGVGATFTYASGQLATVVAPDAGVGTFSYDGNNKLQTITAPGSRVTTLTQSSGEVRGLTNPDGGLRTFTYSAAHRALNQQAEHLNTTYGYDSASGMLTSVDRGGGETLTLSPYLYRALGTSPALGTTNAGALVQDALGNVTTTVLDGAGQATKQTAADGGVTSWTRNSGELPTLATDPLSRKTTYTYDSAGDVTRTDYADGTNTQDAYDSTFHRVTRHQDQLGHATTYTYDGSTGDLLTMKDATGAVTSYTYTAGLVQTITDPLGRTTSYLYDASRRLTAQVDALGDRTSYAYDAAGNQTTATDALGRVTTSAYDAMRRVTVQVDALGNRTTSVYDTRSNLLSQTDPLGRIGTYLYDTLGRQSGTIDALGNRTTTLYDVLDRVTATLDPLNHRTTYAYDSVGRQTAVTAADGGVTTSAYDLAGELTKTTDPLNHTTSYQYDLVARQTAVIDALGNRSTTIYDNAGNVSAVVDPLNHRTSYAYDSLNRQTQVTDALNNLSTTVYDQAGNMVASVDPLGHRTSYSYDAINRQTQVQDALGNRSTSVYDAVGNVTVSIDGLGRRTSMAFDALNRSTQVTDALNNLSTTVYDAVRNVTRTVNARGYTTSYAYDAVNRQTQVIDATGDITTTIYDAAGNVARTLDGLGNATTFAYDPVNRQNSVTTPSGGVTTTAYDLAGNITAVTDQLNHTSTYGYDALNRKTVTIDALGNRTTAIYDAVGNQVNLIDPDSNKSTFAYDVVNRLTQQVDPLGNAATMAYDAAGRETSATDRLGRRMAFAYDNDDRKTLATWYNAGGTAVNTQTFTYDAVGNQLTAQDANGAYTLGYDAVNRVTSTQEPFGAVLTFAYDPVGNRTSVQDSAGGTMTSVYDAVDRLTTGELGGPSQIPLRIDFTYTARNQIATEKRYDDLAATVSMGETDYTYDSNQRVTNIVHKDGSSTILANYTYAYDLADRVTTQTDNGTVITYTYDATNQVTGDSRTNYSYDGNGNRTMIGYVTGPGNQLLSDGTWTYTYDAEGNTTKKKNLSTGETWTFGYDNLNHLLWAQDRATDGGTLLQIVTTVYDVFGNRIEKDWQGSDSGVQRYAYLDKEVWGDLDNTNTVTDRYVYGDQIDQILARVDTAPATVVFHLTDRVGSVREYLGGSGTVLDTIAYDAFGNVTSETNTTTWGRDRYNFTGREIERVTGDIYYRDREYGPSIGRFRRQDSLGLRPDTNPYRYVGNNPTNSTDPTGETVQIYLKPLRLAGWTRRYHASIVVWDDCTNKIVIYSGDGPGPLGVLGYPFRHYVKSRLPAVGTGTYRSLLGDGPDLLTMSPKTEDSYPAEIVKNPRLRTFDEEVKALDTVFERLTQVTAYNGATGPNSNTYARQLISLAGFKDSGGGRRNGWSYQGDWGYGGKYYDEWGHPTAAYYDYLETLTRGLQATGL